jgi:SAM-dependent methyltransferase
VTVHQIPARALAARGLRFDAITLTDVLEHIPEPRAVLADLARLLEPGGVLAVKVPCGRSQYIKERVIASITGREVSLAVNLVHVNHFTPGSLRRALAASGYGAIVVRTGAPELPPGHPLGNAVRLGVYVAARLPGGVHTPLALNLQAYATTGTA